MVLRPLQNSAAQTLPIRAAVDQMQMPDFVDFFRRADHMSGGDGEKEKSPIFEDRAISKLDRPIVFFGEPRRKRAAGARLVKLERQNLRVQLRLLRVHLSPLTRKGIS